MRAGPRIALFATGLAVIFAIAFGLGSLFDPAETDAGGAHDGQMPQGHSSEGGSAAAAPSGLAVSGDGYTLRLEPILLAPRQVRQLRFRVIRADGGSVRDFDELHEREMHLIVVRRDGSHFQHLHPTMDPRGGWSVGLELPEAGVYRVFADFSVAGRAHTLAGDLFVPGPFTPQPTPPPSSVDELGAYRVELQRDRLSAGHEAALTFTVTRGGRPVGLDDYLGAKGHLVALREGDMAFLHVHPQGPADGTPRARNEIAFAADFPTPGRYRLYLQFKHDDEVRTVEYTVEVPR